MFKSIYKPRSIRLAVSQKQSYRNRIHDNLIGSFDAPWTLGHSAKNVDFELSNFASRFSGVSLKNWRVSEQQGVYPSTGQVAAMQRHHGSCSEADSRKREEKRRGKKGRQAGRQASTNVP